jgi:hypothetical protein
MAAVFGCDERSGQGPEGVGNGMSPAGRRPPERSAAAARIGKGVIGPVLLYIPAVVELGFAHTAILHELP